MRNLPFLRIFIFVGLVILVEYYAYTSLKTSAKQLGGNLKYAILGLYILFTILWVIIFLSFPAMRRADIARPLMNLGMVFFMAFFVLKLTLASFLLIDDARRLIFWVSSNFYTSRNTPAIVENGMSRSDFLRQAGLIVGSAMFGMFFYGMRNRHRYDLHKMRINFPNLPKSFDGLKVIQISDIHSGSFTDKAGVQRGVDLINAQQADLVLFTGDLVNNKSSEMYGFIDIFKQIRAKYGVYSIMGNHDYGDYNNWSSDGEKNENLEELKRIHKACGWQLLLDQNVRIEKDGESIGLIGVENISASFRSYGSLQKAYQGIEKEPFKILMSHDPSHWNKEVTTQFRDIDLTLSGHTHGFQFGIEIPGFKWSPAKFIYKQWAGLYQEGQQFIYVNRGFGFLGYPGRIGILPEITMLELKAA